MNEHLGLVTHLIMFFCGPMLSYYGHSERALIADRRKVYWEFVQLLKDLPPGIDSLKRLNFAGKFCLGEERVFWAEDYGNRQNPPIEATGILLLITEIERWVLNSIVQSAEIASSDSLDEILSLIAKVKAEASHRDNRFGAANSNE